MKLAFERTPQSLGNSFHCEIVKGSSYNATWHFHPEAQLTLVLKSSGYRLVGDNISPLRPGDLVLVGSGVPHVWHQDEMSDNPQAVVHAIVVRFLETFLGREFLEIPEATAVRNLLKRAKRGLHITGQTRKTVADKLQELPNAKGLERVAKLLAILDILANSHELEPIASPLFQPVLSNDDKNRLGRVMDYIHSNFCGEINRNMVAEVAHLSIGAFSRYFKLRTGKTFPQYVNELRIGRACLLLARENLKVTDIAFESGFDNLANFNRCFRRITKLTPRSYQRRLQEGAGGTI